MLFQAIDDNKNCVGIYTNGELIFDNLPSDLTKTWIYAEYLEGYEATRTTVEVGALPTPISVEFKVVAHK